MRIPIPFQSIAELLSCPFCLRTLQHFHENIRPPGPPRPRPFSALILTLMFGAVSAGGVGIFNNTELWSKAAWQTSSCVFLFFPRPHVYLPTWQRDCQPGRHHILLHHGRVAASLPRLPVICCQHCFWPSLKYNHPKTFNYFNLTKKSKTIEFSVTSMWNFVVTIGLNYPHFFPHVTKKNFFSAVTEVVGNILMQWQTAQLHSNQRIMRRL